MPVPSSVIQILHALETAGFEAFVVGGCVRDLLLGKEPKDWDVTTDARPEQVLALFGDAKYENEFGTVLISLPEAERTETLKSVEVTTYRSEQGYRDRRHPDEVRFEDDIEKDLERRDFTINAMALGKNPKPETKNSKHVTEMDGWALIDLFGGQKDLQKKVIRAVGEPADRFKEDALRMLRAVRFAVQLGFELEPKTERAIAKLAGSIKFIANERIHDELVKILQSDRPAEGILMLQQAKLLRYIIPELEEGVGVQQNKHHTYTVFKHLIESLRHTPSTDYRVRLAALLHDIGKPKTKEIRNGEATFYNHEYIGSKMTRRILTRLKFSRDDIEFITNLVRNHMFYYNVGEVTEASVRRLIKKVGRENLQDLIHLRVADRLGSGTPKAMPYKLRHLQYMMEKVQNDPVSVKMLKLNGDQLMPLLGIEPGPKIGAILDVLLAEVIEDPSRNDHDILAARAKELNEMDLEQLRAAAREAIEEKREEEDEEIKKNYWVK